MKTNDEEDEEDEEEEDRADEPPVVREPDEDQSMYDGALCPQCKHRALSEGHR